MFIPYSSLKIVLDGERLRFSLPWINIEAAIIEADLSKIKGIINKLPNNIESEFFQKFLEPLQGYSKVLKVAKVKPKSYGYP